MKLLSIQDVPAGDVERTFGHRPWGALIMLAIVLGGPMAAAWALVGEITSLASKTAWWIWVIASPFALIVFLLWLIIVSAGWQAVKACFRRSNWVMKLTFGGPYLQIRSYLNHHFPNDVPTVLYLRWADITAAQKSLVPSPTRDSDGIPTTYNKPFLDLHLKHDVPEAIKQAIAAEASRQPPTKHGTSMKFYDVPVQVPGPSVVRVEWRGRKMLKALRPLVTILPKRRVIPGYDDAPARRTHTPSADRHKKQIVKLIQQVDRAAAIRAAQDPGDTQSSEADSFVSNSA